MGNALKDQGKLEEAIAAYSKALSIKPDYAEAYRNLSSIKKYEKDDNQIIQVQELYKRKDLSKDTRCHLNFALAKIYEDIGKLDEAFAHLSKGNALRKNLLKYSIKNDQELFTKLKNAQPYLLKNALEMKENPIEPTPIFIVGMPRSGTSLLEQILSTHSKIYGAGELNYLQKIIDKSGLEKPNNLQNYFNEIRKYYYGQISKISNSEFIIDKLPSNFRWIGFIVKAFPEAKIIHIQRNPMAVCWSN